MEVKKKAGDDEQFFQSNLVTTHRDVSSLHKVGRDYQELQTV